MASPNFRAARAPDEIWLRDRQWMKQLGYRGVALDFRGDALARRRMEEVAATFRDDGFAVLPIGHQASAGPWIAWHEDWSAAAAALQAGDCVESIWAPTGPSVITRDSDPCSVRLFIDGTSSPAWAATLARPLLRAPSWIDGHKHAPQTLVERGAQVRGDRRVGGSRPRWSFVIPSHRHRAELANTLRALRELDRDIEVIVVDDNLMNESSLSEELASTLPLLWLAVPRLVEREFGDRGFCAGALRNLGARYARGERLVFLDADIIVPPDFLTMLEQVWRPGALHQAMRWNLRAGLNLEERSASSLSAEWDCVLSYRGAWEKFQSAQNPWRRAALPWQWVSTFCLAVARDHFTALGGFRESFDRYGFEDTEFGLRAWRSGAALVRVECPVFHQHHLTTRSEYGGSSATKRLLRLAAFPQFFRWALDPTLITQLNSP